MEIIRLIAASIILLVGGIVFVMIYANKGFKFNPSKRFSRTILGGLALGLTFFCVYIIAETQFTMASIIIGICGFTIGAFAITFQRINQESKFVLDHKNQLSKTMIMKSRDKWMHVGCSVIFVAVIWTIFVLITGGLEKIWWGIISGVVVGIITMGINWILNQLGLVTWPHQYLSENDRSRQDENK